MRDRLEDTGSAHSAELGIGGLQGSQDPAEGLLVGIPRGQTHAHPSYADAHLSPDLQQLQPDGVTLGTGELRAPQGPTAQLTEDQIGDRGEEEPQLIGPEAGWSFPDFVDR